MIKEGIFWFTWSRSGRLSVAVVNLYVVDSDDGIPSRAALSFDRNADFRVLFDLRLFNRLSQIVNYCMFLPVSSFSTLQLDRRCIRSCDHRLQNVCCPWSWLDQLSSRLLARPRHQFAPKSFFPLSCYLFGCKPLLRRVPSEHFYRRRGIHTPETIFKEIFCLNSKGWSIFIRDQST